ncbi:MAG: hypothetical protein RLZZ31_583 [Actinomycetota bacterium]|jgi:pyridoxal phosphate enzyme (YggS family)
MKTTTPEIVAQNIEQVRTRIANVAHSQDVKIVAVTKGFDVTAPRAALAQGLFRCGENYAQELIEKHAQLTDDERQQIEWHFLGRLQSNKIRQLVEIVSVWQSIDRLSLIQELERRSPGAKVMIQVNISNEPQKGGVAPSEALALVDAARSHQLVVCGLMGVGAFGDDNVTQAGFAQLAELALSAEVPEISMGMTDDLELAIAAGSTMVRIGTAIFGSRT